jgi:hypothetical protein
MPGQAPPSAAHSSASALLVDVASLARLSCPASRPVVLPRSQSNQTYSESIQDLIVGTTLSGSVLVRRSAVCGMPAT